MGLVADYIYDARCERVIDGDTLVLVAMLVPQRVVVVDGQAWYDLGFGQLTYLAMADHPAPYESKFRLLDIDAPELHGARKEAGEAAKKALEGCVTGHPLKVRSRRAEKYGRWLAELWLTRDYQMGCGETINAWMVADGHAVPVKSRLYVLGRDDQEAA